MPNATDQPSDGSRRGTLVILVLAAAVAAGLWFYLDRPGAPTSPERLGPTEPAAGAATDDARTTTPDVPRTADTGTTSSDVDSRTAGADTVAPKDATRTAEADATIQAEEPGTSEVESEATTDIALTTDTGATAQDGDSEAAGAGTEIRTDLARTPDAGTAGGAPSAADSATDVPTDVALTTDAGAATREEDSETAGAGTEVRTDLARTPAAGTAGEAPNIVDSATEVPTDVALTTDAGAATREEDSGAVDSETEVWTDLARTPGAGTADEAPSIADTTGTTRSTDDGTGDASGIARTAGTDSAEPSSDGARTADSATTEDAQQLAGAEPTVVPAKDELVLAPAPELTVESSPIDAPPVDETTGVTSVLAAVEDTIERIGSAIRERLDLESEADADTKLRVQVTYDDSQEDAAQDDGGSNVAAQNTESDASIPTEETPTPKSDVVTGTDLAKPAEPDVATGTDLAKPAEPDVATGTDLAEPAEPDVATGTDLAEPAESDIATGIDLAKLSESDDVAARATDTDASTPADHAPTRDSDVDTDADIAQSTEPAVAAPSDVTQPADTASAEADAEAKEFVETLTDTAPETIAVDRADHFVTQERMISLVPEDSIESVTLDDLAKDESLTSDTPITVVREVEQIEPAVPEQLIAESGGDLDKPLRVRVTYDDSQDTTEQDGSGSVAVEEDVVEQAAVREPQERIGAESDDSQDTTELGGSGPTEVKEDIVEQKAAVREPQERIGAESDDSQDTTERDGSGPVAMEETVVEEITVREALERIRAEPERPLTVIKKVRYFEVMTLRELLDTVADSDTFLNVVTRPYRIESATLADILRQHKAENPDSIFYIHTVQPTDEQGIWGIVQFGLIDNFARGMAIRHGKDIETYTVRIPRDADERLEDQSSSFLGRLIDRKTKDSYVYNFREHRIGRNPDRIYPGQELVIINFEPEELMSIYRHFDSG